METNNYLAETRMLDSFDQEVLETYERADESTRMDMYMTFRELREEFEEIEACTGEQSEDGASRAEAEPEKMKWCLCGRLRKAFSG